MAEKMGPLLQSRRGNFPGICVHTRWRKTEGRRLLKRNAASIEQAAFKVGPVGAKLFYPQLFWRIVRLGNRDKIAFAISKLGFFDLVSNNRIFLDSKIFY